MNRFALMAFFLLTLASACTKQKEAPANMPWQVTVTDKGALSVMGVTLGVTTADEAMRTFNAEPEIVLFVDKEGRPSLEAYYGKVATGGLTGTIIANLAVTEPWGKEARGRAVKVARSANGDEKITLARDDYRSALAASIMALTYLPASQLDEATARARFGTPDEVVEGEGEIVYLLYPAKGIIVAVDPKGKESVQYVLPASFAAMVEKATADATGRP